MSNIDVRNGKLFHEWKNFLEDYCPESILNTDLNNKNDINISIESKLIVKSKYENNMKLSLQIKINENLQVDITSI